MIEKVKATLYLCKKTILLYFKMVDLRLMTSMKFKSLFLFLFNK
jgi:hypothetical protein